MRELPKDLSVADGYDAWAATYDTVANPTRDESMAALRAAGLDLAGKAVLELGCGTGLNTEWLAASADEVLALDFSDGMLAQARRRAPRVSFVRHDISQPLPAADGSFDVVVETLVLEHLQRLEDLFAEVRRVLRPGGVFFLSELHPFRQLKGKQARIVDPATGREILIEAYVHSVSEFVNAAVGGGFRVLCCDERGIADDGAPRVFSLTLARD
jgi:malonyl-CoA O-methyltransferase